MSVFTQLLCHKQDVTQGQFLSGILQVLNLEFSKIDFFSLGKAASLPYYLSIAGEKHMDSCLS